MKPSRDSSEQQSFFYVLWPEEKTTSSVASAITLQSPPSVADGNTTEMTQADHSTEETHASTQPSIRSSDFQEVSASHRALVSNSETSSSTDSNSRPLQLVPPPPKRHCSSLSSSSSNNNNTGRPIQGSVAAKAYLTPLTQCLECEVKDAEILALRRRIQVLQEHLAVLVGKRNTNHWPENLGDSDNNNTSSGSAIQSDTQDLPLSGPNEQPVNQQRKPPDFQGAQNQAGAGNQDVVELVSGSGVYITSSKLDEALRDAKNGTQLARKLMDAFWDKPTLAKSSVSSRSKYQYEQLDPKIIATIECKSILFDIRQKHTSKGSSCNHD